MILNLIDKQKHVFFLFIKKTHNTQQGLWTWSLVMGTQWGRRSSPIHRFKFFLQRIILHPPHHHHDHPHHHSFHNKLLWSFYNLYQLTLIIAMSHDNHDDDKSRLPRCGSSPSPGRRPLVRRSRHWRLLRWRRFLLWWRWWRQWVVLKN